MIRMVVEHCTGAICYIYKSDAKLVFWVDQGARTGIEFPDDDRLSHYAWWGCAEVWWGWFSDAEEKG